MFNRVRNISSRANVRSLRSEIVTSLQDAATEVAHARSRDGKSCAMVKAVCIPTGQKSEAREHPDAVSGAP